MGDVRPQRPNDDWIAIDNVESITLEVGRLGDIHRRRRSRMRFAGRARTVGKRTKEFVEHIIFIRGKNEPVDRHTHLARDPRGEYIAEVAGGNGERHPLTRFRRRGEIALEVIHHLRGHTCPVNRIDGADAPLRLHQSLAVVERAVDCDVVNVGLVERVHLRLLERAHPAARR